MPKLELTADEINVIGMALDTEIKSAKRSQNTSKSPQIKEVYIVQERSLEQLKAKITSAK